VSNGHVCRRWLEIADYCPLAGRAWHGEPHTEEEEPEDPRRPRKSLRQLQEMPTWDAILEKAQLIYNIRQMLRNSQRDFGKVWRPAVSVAPFPISAAVMMAELGIIQSLAQSNVPSLKPQSEVVRPGPTAVPIPAATPSWFEQFGETFEFGIGEIAAVTIAVGAPIASEVARAVGSPATKGFGFKGNQGMATGRVAARGRSRGGRFQTQSIWGGGGRNPLWKMGMDNGLLLKMAIKTGKGPLELVEEMRGTGQYGIGTQEAFGLFGYI